MPTFTAIRVELYYYDVEADTEAEAQARLDDGDVDWTDAELSYAREGLASPVQRTIGAESAIDAIFDNDPSRGPSCGHSKCSQNYIDTGNRHCVSAIDDEPWEKAWLPAMQQAAIEEGWAIFTVDGDPQIQRVDTPEDANDPDGPPLEPAFANDDCAIAYVLGSANAGSYLHKLAMSIHRITYPEA